MIIIIMITLIIIIMIMIITMCRRSELLFFYQDGASHLFPDKFQPYRFKPASSLTLCLLYTM